jgi:hypothetical protein
MSAHVFPGRQCPVTRFRPACAASPASCRRRRGLPALRLTPARAGKPPPGRARLAVPATLPWPGTTPAVRRYLFRGVRAVFARAFRSGRPQLSTDVNQSTAAPGSRDPGKPPAEPPAARTAPCPPRPPAARTALTWPHRPAVSPYGGRHAVHCGWVRDRAGARRALGQRPAAHFSSSELALLRAKNSCHLEELKSPSARAGDRPLG